MPECSGSFLRIGRISNLNGYDSLPHGWPAAGDRFCAVKREKRKNYASPLTFRPKLYIISYVAEVIRYMRYMMAVQVRLAQLDRAFGYGPKGRGFESSSAR